jgi:hypothetical protein
VLGAVIKEMSCIINTSNFDITPLTFACFI